MRSRMDLSLSGGIVNPSWFGISVLLPRLELVCTSFFLSRLSQVVYLCNSNQGYLY